MNNLISKQLIINIFSFDINYLNRYIFNKFRNIPAFRISITRFFYYFYYLKKYFFNQIILEKFYY